MPRALTRDVLAGAQTAHAQAAPLAGAPRSEPWQVEQNRVGDDGQERDAYRCLHMTTCYGRGGVQTGRPSNQPTERSLERVKRRLDIRYGRMTATGSSARNGKTMILKVMSTMPLKRSSPGVRPTNTINTKAAGRNTPVSAKQSPVNPANTAATLMAKLRSSVVGSENSVAAENAMIRIMQRTTRGESIGQDVPKVINVHTGGPYTRSTNAAERISNSVHLVRPDIGTSTGYRARPKRAQRRA